MPSLGTLLHLLSLLVAVAAGAGAARRLAVGALPALPRLYSTRERRRLDRELPVARYVKHKHQQHGAGQEAAAAAAAEAEERCAFCLSGMEDGEEVRVLRCRHLFHRCCLDRWLAARPGATCPLCRGQLLATAAATACAGGGPAAEEVEEEGATGMAAFVAYVRRCGWFWRFGM